MNEKRTLLKLEPISVRPTDDGMYQIHTGHNRVNVAKIAGIETRLELVKEELSDDEPTFLVINQQKG